MTGATGTAIGTGKSNTTAIIASQGPGIYAATICTDYSNNGYNDWFLPSLDEMIQMHDNLFDNGIGGLNWDYWTSTETSSTDAYYIFINTPSWSPLNKNMLRGVRAIRAF